MEWDLPLKYKGTKFVQKATVDYKSKQIIRIRVTGTKSSLLLENNYPGIHFTNSKRGVKWKIREGKLTAGNKEDAQLLVDIFQQLEYQMKKDFYKIYPDEQILFS